MENEEERRGRKRRKGRWKMKETKKRNKGK